MKSFRETYWVDPELRVFYIVLYLCRICSDSVNYTNSHFSLLVTKLWTLSTMPVLSVYINDCYGLWLLYKMPWQIDWDSCGKISVHWLPKSRGTFLPSIFGRQIPNINLSWGGVHVTYARTVIISSFCSAPWQLQHKNVLQQDKHTSVFYCEISVVCSSWHETGNPVK